MSLELFTLPCILVCFVWVCLVVHPILFLIPNWFCFYQLPVDLYQCGLQTQHELSFVMADIEERDRIIFLLNV